jgi:hypothetical protein
MIPAPADSPGTPLFQTAPTSTTWTTSTTQAPSGGRVAVRGRRSAVGGRRSAVGGRRSAVGGRRSAVGGRRSAREYLLRREVQ